LPAPAHLHVRSTVSAWLLSRAVSVESAGCRRDVGGMSPDDRGAATWPDAAFARAARDERDDRPV